MLGFGIPGMMAAVGGSGGGGGIIQLTGDVAAGPGSGSQGATLATVNSNVGTFGNGTTVPVVTVNAKGLVTAVSTAAVSGSGGNLGVDTFRAETLDPADAQWANATNAPIGSSVSTTSVQVAQYTADSMAAIAYQVCTNAGRCAPTTRRSCRAARRVHP